MATKQDFQIVFGEPLARNVLEHLTAMFYDIDAWDKDNPYHTSYLAGQRSVMKYILRQIAEPQPREEDIHG